jgi:hypothetical protein
VRFLFSLRLDILKHNSNFQDGGIRIEYTFIGIFSAKSLGFNSKKWFFEFHNLPKKIRIVIIGR